MTSNIILAPQSHNALIYVNGSLLTNNDTGNAIRTPVELTFQEGNYNVLLKDDQGIYDDIIINIGIPSIQMAYDIPTNTIDSSRFNSSNLPIYSNESLDIGESDVKSLQETSFVNSVEGILILSFVASLLASYVAIKQFEKK